MITTTAQPQHVDHHHHLHDYWALPGILYPTLYDYHYPVHHHVDLYYHDPFIYEPALGWFRSSKSVTDQLKSSANLKQQTKKQRKRKHRKASKAPPSTTKGKHAFSIQKQTQTRKKDKLSGRKKPTRTQSSLHKRIYVLPKKVQTLQKRQPVLRKKLPKIAQQKSPLSKKRPVKAKRRSSVTARKMKKKQVSVKRRLRTNQRKTQSWNSKKSRKTNPKNYQYYHAPGMPYQKIRYY